MGTAYDAAMHIFLDDAELAQLTGRKLKSKQIAWLKQSGIRFWVNATGHAVVPRSAIEGTPVGPRLPTKEPWVPRVLQDGRSKATP